MSGVVDGDFSACCGVDRKAKQKAEENDFHREGFPARVFFAEEPSQGEAHDAKDGAARACGAALEGEPSSLGEKDAGDAGEGAGEGGAGEDEGEQGTAEAGAHIGEEKAKGADGRLDRAAGAAKGQHVHADVEDAVVNEER